MMRAAVLVMLAGCMQQHEPEVAAITLRDCYTCHRAEYEAAPNHTTRSTTCVNCHRLRDWNGLFEGTHPDAQFPISYGPHRDIFCADCHDPDINPDSTVRTPISPLEPALQPDNVVCTSCHAHEIGRMARKHHEVRSYAPTRCRACHKLGLNADD